MEEIIERMKDMLSSNGVNGKIKDKDVSKALSVSQYALASHKKRKSIPYKDLVVYCAINKISINWLLFGQNINSLKDGVNLQGKYQIKKVIDL